MAEPIATLSKDGQTRQAFKPAEVVALKYDGWRVVPDAPVPPRPSPTPPEPDAPEPATTDEVPE